MKCKAAIFTTALPGGSRNYNSGFFGNLNTHANFFSSTQDGATTTGTRTLIWIDETVGSGSNLKTFGFPARCIKD